MLLNPSSLCSLHERLVNPRDQVLRQGIRLSGKPADQEDSRLMSQNNQLVGVWMSSSFMDQRLGWGQGNKVKKAINLASISENGKPQAGGCVNFNFFLPSTGRQGFEQRHFSLTVRQGAGFSEAGHYV